MHLYYVCPNCMKVMTIPARASDRIVLAKKIGNKFRANCTQCGWRKDIHVNEVQAEEKKLTSILVFILLITGTIVLYIWFWDYLRNSEYSGLIIIGVIMIPALIHKKISLIQKGKVHRFNSTSYE